MVVFIGFLKGLERFDVNRHASLSLFPLGARQHTRRD